MFGIRCCLDVLLPFINPLCVLCVCLKMKYNRPAILYIRFYSPIMVAENKNVHIAHITRNLTKRRLCMKVTRKFY